MNELETAIAKALALIEQDLFKHLQPKFAQTEQIRTFACLNFSTLKHEQFGCMFFNKSSDYLGYKIIGIGTLGQCCIYPRELIRQALEHNASFVILVHNHPLGSVQPSKDDLETTSQLQKVLAIVDVQLLDHLIVAGTKVESLKDNGYF
jgi:DNA repair protein RadC